MKKTLVGFLLLPAIVLGIATVAFSGEGAWMDMKNCEMCKPVMEQDPNLMKNMTWEHHNISNGLVSVSTVTPAYMAHYKKAGEKMKMVTEKLQKGTDVKLCNMCVAMSDMLKTGKVKNEHIMTSNGSVALMTSEDPRVVRAIQQWGERTNEEMRKMSAEPQMSKMTKPGQGY